MDHRLLKTYLTLKAKNLDCLIIYSAANVSYLTRTNSREAYLLISRKKNLYFTDSRFFEEAKCFLSRRFEVRKVSGPLPEMIAGACEELKCRRVGFEEDNVSVGHYRKLAHLMRTKSKLTPTQHIVEDIRQIKEPAEIEKIRKALSITIQTLNFAKTLLRPQRKEIEIVAELQRFLRLRGSGNSAFDIIVASGANASFPHHASGEKKLTKHEPVLIDIGVDYQGYKSDLTRVYFMGKINSLTERAYQVVREAQTIAIAAIAPGTRAHEIDALARNHIVNQGFGEFFGHSLGHGVGIEVHEQPRISSKNTLPLEPGMVFTIEPGVYLPGKFGIRIEDMVLVTKKGCEVLSGALDQ